MKRIVKWSEHHGKLMEYNITKRGDGSRVYWSPQMLSILKAKYPFTRDEEMAEMFNVGRKTLMRKARELGLKKDPEYIRRVRTESSRLGVLAAKRMGFPTRFKKGVQNGVPFAKGRKISDEEKQANRERMHRYWLLNPDVKRRYSETMKANWQDPIWREKKIKDIKRGKRNEHQRRNGLHTNG